MQLIGSHGKQHEPLSKYLSAYKIDILASFFTKPGPSLTELEPFNYVCLHPNNGYPAAAIDSFYADPNIVLSKLAQRDTTVILGDSTPKSPWSKEPRRLHPRLFLIQKTRVQHHDIDTPTQGPLHLQPNRLYHLQPMEEGLCSNAQYWEGILTLSAHKLVTLDSDLLALRGLRQRQEQAHNSEAESRLATHLLVRDRKYRSLYRQLLERNLVGLPQQRTNMDQHWTTTLNSALEAAVDSVGYMPLGNHVKELDPDLSRLPYEQRQLRQPIYNIHKQATEALRTKRNRLLHWIQERSKAVA
ncbi:RxLR effector candidate protein [Phytophthora palmivora]|uniref:RxLR effector candidate protein n=1 Tax=Phytophthora palmivora TaxID=4796 RepID=A0A2P4XBS5_9STRA|nr:RxLR effector candidate protein [Phytophthora palmivora]